MWVKLFKESVDSEMECEINLEPTPTFEGLVRVSEMKGEPETSGRENFKKKKICIKWISAVQQNKHCKELTEFVP